MLSRFSITFLCQSFLLVSTPIADRSLVHTKHLWALVYVRCIVLFLHILIQVYVLLFEAKIAMQDVPEKILNSELQTSLICVLQQLESEGWYFSSHS